MAKSSARQKEYNRQAKVKRYAERREALVAQLKDKSATAKERFEAGQEIQRRIPKNASPVRLHNRCSIDGRPKGYNRKLGISRVAFRKMALEGKIPGVRKSSW